MMATMEAGAFGRLVLLVIAIGIALAATGCASGPLGSHGVAYIPAFDSTPPNQ
jgi:hypothetical protein